MKAREVRLVEWIDSSASSGWQSCEDAAKIEPDPCMSVGFVIHETDDHLTLLQSVTNRKSGKDHADHVLAIPKCSITRTVVLRKAR